jgi:hypothetical protein
MRFVAAPLAFEFATITLGLIFALGVSSGLKARKYGD